MEDIRFYGYDIFSYYWYLFRNHFVGWPWQILIAYSIVILCAISFIVIGITFFIKVRKRNKFNKKQEEISEKYSDTFRQILLNPDEMLSAEILSLVKQCDDKDEDEIKENAKYYIPILVSIRTEMSETAYFPNLQSLVTAIGVREYCENSLLHNKDVFNTLQMMAMMQMIISEGRLANYVNHKDKDIRMMARLCYIICSISEPYKYLAEELDNSSTSIMPMILHYIFAWMRYLNKKMPNFISISNNINNEDSIAFLINEMVYWGDEKELDNIPSFFTSSSIKCREASIKISYLLNKQEVYDELMRVYERQPEYLKRLILNSLSIHKNEKFNTFFEQCYESSLSKETKEVALQSMYKNGRLGKIMFKKIYKTCSEEDKILLDKIKSIDSLNV